MTRERWLAVGAAAAALVAGLAIGRWAAPARVLERDRIVTVDRETSSAWRAYVGQTITRARTETRWKTVTVWAKDGGVTQTAVALAEQATDASSTATEHQAAVRESVRSQDVSHERRVEVHRPNWLIGGGAGYDLGRRELVYGLQVGRRLAGPVFVELAAAMPRSVSINLKLAF